MPAVFDGVTTTSPVAPSVAVRVSSSLYQATMGSLTHKGKFAFTLSVWKTVAALKATGLDWTARLTSWP